MPSFPAGKGDVLDLCFEQLLFVDLEASGLHATSFPIEIGWCDLELRPGSFLIRPHENWTKLDWNTDSERIHGIGFDECRANGLPASSAAEVFNELVAGRILVSDAPRYDGMWLDALRAVVPSLVGRPILHLNHVLLSAMNEAGLEARAWPTLRDEIDAGFPHLHRAAADALRMAAMVRAVLDPDFVRAAMKTMPGGRASDVERQDPGTSITKS